MNQLFSFIKSHLALILLLVVIAYLLLNHQPVNTFNLGRSEMAMDSGDSSYPMKSLAPAPGSSLPPVESSDRLVIRDTTLSMVVMNVVQVLSAIEGIAQNLEGYLVDSDLLVPEGAASGTITLRIPETKRQAALAAIKDLGVKVISEHVSGRDVTDEYVDLEARLETLNLTKAKFTQILDQAVRIQDLLEVQRELINLQAQIDSLKGRQLYLEQSAKLTKITVYLSTDEFGLPYTPAETWRPEVIFKQAVRSLVKNMRNIGTALIWLAVYAPVLIVIWLAYFLFRRRRSHSS